MSEIGETGLEVGTNSDTTPVTIKESSVDVPKRDLDKTLWEKISSLFGVFNADTTTKSSKPEQAPKSTTDNLPL